MGPWQEAMREADCSGDGALSFLEFQDGVKMAEEKVLALAKAEEESNTAEEKIVVCTKPEEEMKMAEEKIDE
jgi:hypothetical protein